MKNCKVRSSPPSFCSTASIAVSAGSRHFCITVFTVFAFAVFSVPQSLFAGETAELIAAKNRFTQLQHPTEADRQDYILSLTKLRSRFADQGQSEACSAVDAEVLGYPAPENTGGYSKIMVGQWCSPRHEYVYRADGTWSMLPEETGITHGRWRIEGNKFFSSAEVDPEITRAYTIILLTDDDFVFTDGEAVFYETRSR